jgi:hypothetical protein
MFQQSSDGFVPTVTERFAEAEKLADREARWTAQATVAMETGDMYLVGLVLFKAIQEFGVEAFAARSGEPLQRLQRLWMPGVLTSPDQAGRMYSHLGVTVGVERFHAARLSNMPMDGASVH